jgi:methylated-DNA-protein-cysteine methyltransferase-like protein
MYGQPSKLSSGKTGRIFRKPLQKIRFQGKDPGSSFERIRAVVSAIPRGRVATYGQVARIAGLPGAARTVSWALATLPRGTGVPWHRVLGSGGRISLERRDPVAAARQRRRLRRERVGLRRDGTIDLARYGWEGPE